MLGVLLFACMCASAHAKPWWTQEAKPAEKTTISDVLGSDPLMWKHVDSKGNPVDPTVTKVDEYTALSTADAHLVKLLGLQRLEPDTELSVRVKFTAPEYASSYLTLNAGLKDSSDMAEQGLRIQLTGTGNGNTISCASQYEGERKSSPYNFGLHFKGHTTRKLEWPEAIRKTVESNMALVPKSTEKWVTLRLILRENAFQIFLEDRLARDESGETSGFTGHVRLTLGPNTYISSVRVKKLAPKDPIFETVALKGYVNESEIKGSSISRESLPLPDKVAMVNNIPFVFPEPDEKGNDHIDIERSWVYFANAEAYLTTMPRWQDAGYLDPARIKLAVPTDLYSNIHFIAAADGDDDSVPVITAQFYYPSIGFPKHFEGRAPLFSKKASKVVRLPVKQENGKKGNLYLVTIPIQPGEISSLVNWDKFFATPTSNVYGGTGRYEIELTKEIRQFREYPDPICYDFHPAGRPSGVHVYAMTLERPPVHMEFDPDNFAHVWVGPDDMPSYTVTLDNRTPDPREVKFVLTTLSDDGKESTNQEETITVPANAIDHEVKFKIELEKYGYHKVVLTMTDEDRDWVENRSLVRIQSDTRERGNWEVGKGALYGFWDYGNGVHCGPGGPGRGLRGLKLMFDAGAETGSWDIEESLAGVKDKEKYEEIARKMAEEAGYLNTHFVRQHQVPSHKLGKFYTPDKEGWTREWAIEKSGEFIAEHLFEPNPFRKPEFMMFWAEPVLGTITTGNFAEYWGGKPYVLTDRERSIMTDMSNRFVVHATGIKKRWPDVKLLMPYGDPLFVVPFLREKIITPDLLDGTALDICAFERMPEQQLHQISTHRIWTLREEYKKFGHDDPYLILIEGPFIPTLPGACTYKEQANRYTRHNLLMMGYDVHTFLGSWQAFDFASYYGGEHYGNAGIIERIPHCSPKQGYAAFATMTRHLNRVNFDKWIPTGSLSTYAMQFKHYKTGELVHAIWTIRGKRPVTVKVPAGAKVQHFTLMDNETKLTAKNGKVSFEIDPSPCFVHGLGDNPTILLGKPDHSDAVPAPDAVVLSNMGNGEWTMSTDTDPSYENNSYLQVDRKVGNMAVRVVNAPKNKGKKALAVHLSKHNKPRRTMPYYTSLLPDKPIEIPGKASHIGIWAKASSDWGRVVYCLRDAAGERWISVGTKDQWNCDDVHSRSYFNFDDWRYIRFEMPSHAEYDSYRELGTTWWGHPEEGDGVIDLPLSLEKVIVERRTHAMYVNDPQPTNGEDVLLGDLYVEYAKPFDKTEKAVKLSRLRMPIPEGVPGMENPIEKMMVSGVGAPTKVISVEDPHYRPDGRKCHVNFETVPDAQSYDIWVSAYPDGTGALKLAQNWKESGQIVRGLRPELDFYVFVVYKDKDGKESKPSAPLKIKLKDIFSFK